MIATAILVPINCVVTAAGAVVGCPITTGIIGLKTIKSLLAG